MDAPLHVEEKRIVAMIFMDQSFNQREKPFARICAITLIERYRFMNSISNGCIPIGAGMRELASKLIGIEESIQVHVKVGVKLLHNLSNNFYKF